ncbi:UNVERIFIED_CONTAM: hypothetical protein Sradi_0478000 [Sesamum radiatum]|uniref:Uncharacterized protein n=1 Tax=Sesamum radiatum TaxID=300843 RepID=A0AAW2WAE4_SESRA
MKRDLIKLLVKAEYNPKEKLSLEKLPPEATGKNLHGLNATQIMLKEKRYAIQDSRIGLGFIPPKSVRIAIKRVSSNYIAGEFSLIEDDKGKRNLREFVFNRLRPNRTVCRASSKQFVFDSLGPYGEVEEEDAEDARVELEEDVKAIVDKLKEVNLGNNENPRSIYTSASLTQEEEGAYIALLHEFKDVFAWSYEEMPRLDSKVAVHHLLVKKGARPVNKANVDFDLS